MNLPSRESLSKSGPPPRSKLAPKKLEQASLLDVPADWEEHWKGMPDFNHKNLASWQKIIVHLRNAEDRKEFSRLMGQTLTDNTRSIWYPKAEISRMLDKRWTTEKAVVPRWTVYIPSKGRADSRLTMKALDKIGVPFKVVVEPQEFDAYAAVTDPERILTLPFSDQGLAATRIWIKAHSIDNGDDWHWQIDDNVHDFWRFHDNNKIPVSTGWTFRVIEDYVERYENVALAGMQYFMFAPKKNTGRIPAVSLNTRIYSIILFRNSLPHEWRGPYNDDTDMSLRVLKDGWCTVLFNAFLARKATTMTVKGGMGDLYDGDGRLKGSELLRSWHPDVTKVTRKWGRWHHHVDYKPFRKNKLILKPDAVIPDGDDDYGVQLIHLTKQEQENPSGFDPAEEENNAEKENDDT